MKISISTSNKKMNNIPSFSLVPGTTCSEEACKTCYKNCYAKKMMNRRKNIKKAWTNNTIACKENLQDVKNQVCAWLTLNDPKYFRVHVGGDFFSQKYTDMWIDIARQFPTTVFFGYTKRAEFFKDNNRPDNFKIYYSSWVGCDIPTVNMPIAWYQDGTEKRIPEGTATCNGDCKVCKHCINGEKDIIFMKH